MVDINNMKTLDVLKTAVMAPVVILLKFASSAFVLYVDLESIRAHTASRPISADVVLAETPGITPDAAATIFDRVNRV